MFRFLSLSLLIIPLVTFGQKIAVVDVQKVFDGYQKVIDARERLEKSSSIAKEEIDIFKDELSKIVKEIREMEEKLKNPNIESSALKGKWQEKVKQAQAKREDMLEYEKRARATISQRQKNLLVEHLGDIREAIEKISKSRSIDLVLNSSETQLGVFFVSDKLDITENVILALNSSKKTV
jgi:Skp family chaperone for outer membrane proteins